MDVPWATSLKDIYPESVWGIQKQRWEHLLAKFEEHYGRPAEFVSRSPGRVNIIGEHIDYSLYEVLPMAVTADLLLAVALKRGSPQPRFRIANVRSEKFPERDFGLNNEGDVEIDPSSLEWSNYFKSGLRGALQLLRKNHPKFALQGMDILVDGTVPSGGGLSSSAAFVCASSLAVMVASGEEKVDKRELVELAIVSERAVGVNSGGMDQSASVFSIRGNALYVSFKPELRAEPIKFPNVNPELTFLIAQSFVAADKHVTAPVCYNLRVVECSLAAEFLAKKLGLKRALPKDTSPLQVSLRGFQDTYFEEIGGIQDNNQTVVSDFSKQLEELVELTKRTLTQEDGYTREEISAIVGIPVEEINQRFMSRFPVRAERFLLRQRALHVFTEAQRVLRFRSLLSNPPSLDESLLRSLGALMQETQTSCRELYDCSCPELDEMCKLAREAGAYGGRLTGAGWGGCSVHLVPYDKVDEVKKMWETRYYRRKFPNMAEDKLAEAVVVSKPGSGSTVFKVTGRNVL
ncbi:galactokinase [Xylona heveae TC161]|uniref:Galactokinase n=1 Tax=Xylona heveae (strain CBS 132557 / TC161) TaxID=1328760 RepID=A0A165A0V1_XYLHT|nr:galactokinase [Xylona heveae TC161]KZF19796.1 galactokinase [Xylona heveae TC161]